MLSVSVSNQTFLVAGAVCAHPLPEFPDMRRGWKAELTFGADACTVALANSNARPIRTEVLDLTAGAAAGFLFEADEWRVLGTDGSLSLIPFPGAFDTASLLLAAPAPAQPAAPVADKPAAPDVFTKGFLEPGMPTAIWEFAVLGEGSKLLARAQGTTSGDCGNIGGELAACMRAVQWAINNGHPAITLHYEYPGCEHWVRGNWHANKPMTIAYADFMRRAAGRLTIWFRQVPSRRGDQARVKQAPAAN